MSREHRADILADFERRLMSQLTPSLNAGTAMEMLILVGQTIREMRASSAPPEPEQLMVQADDPSPQCKLCGAENGAHHSVERIAEAALQAHRGTP